MHNDTNNENARNENFTGILIIFSYPYPLFSYRNLYEEIFEFIGLIDLKTHGYHLTLTYLPQG